MSQTDFCVSASHLSGARVESRYDPFLQVALYMRLGVAASLPHNYLSI